MEKILDVESDPLEAGALATILAGEYRLVHCPDPRRALDAMELEAPAAVLFDIGAPGSGGLETLSSLAGRAARPPVIVMGPSADPRAVVRAVRCGAADYLAKPLELRELKSALRSIIVPPSPAPFVGMSPVTIRAAELVRRYARSDFPVLILGESGTGKEIAARAIHELSRRSCAPFMARNCAALPDELIESELFGSARGAFTGAIERPGAFELAKGGTLFLDEIGEARLPVQAKLLRVLESGEFWRLGDSKARRIDIRLVSATSRDLRRGAAESGFRPDLFYRIETLVLELAPLRERAEDIRGLADHFILKAAGGGKFLSEFAYEKLEHYGWPGNVRQLRNVVHRAIVLSGDLEEIREDHIVM
jgi:DNA-binding NtrC family response regulator